MNNTKTVIFYHYFELNESYKENLIYFLSTAYNTSNKFVVIISGKHTVELPEHSNIQYLFVENKNHDFGGYISALSQFEDIEDYQYFIFVNSSVRGPFLSSYFTGNWIDLFESRISNDTHLVGSTINMLPVSSHIDLQFKRKYPYLKSSTHVQTTAYGLSLPAVKYLLKIGFYDVSKKLKKTEIIRDYELRLSQEIINNGWNIKCILPIYDSIDYRTCPEDINFASFHGDVLSKGSYFGRTIHPSELVFIKTNRSLISDMDLNSHTYCSLLTNTHPKMEQWVEHIRLKDKAYEEISFSYSQKRVSLHRRISRYFERKIKKRTRKPK